MPTMKNRDDLVDRDVTPHEGYIDTSPSVGVKGTLDKIPRKSEFKIPEGMMQKNTSLMGKLKKLLQSDEESRKKGMAIMSTRPSKEM